MLCMCMYHMSNHPPPYSINRLIGGWLVRVSKKYACENLFRNHSLSTCRWTALKPLPPGRSFSLRAPESVGMMCDVYEKKSRVDIRSPSESR